MEQDTGFEPAPSAWKAEMLAANTNPAYMRSHYCNSKKKQKVKQTTFTALSPLVLKPAARGFTVYFVQTSRYGSGEWI